MRNVFSEPEPSSEPEPQTEPEPSTPEPTTTPKNKKSLYARRSAAPAPAPVVHTGHLNADIVETSVSSSVSTSKGKQLK